MQTTTTREKALEALKKALEHKKEATQSFDEKGIEGKVVTL